MNYAFVTWNEENDRLVMDELKTKLDSNETAEVEWRFKSPDINVGDKVFVYKSTNRKGFIAVGLALSKRYQRDNTYYAKIRINQITDYKNGLLLELQTINKILGKENGRWIPHDSGNILKIDKNEAIQLEQEWTKILDKKNKLGDYNMSKTSLKFIECRNELYGSDDIIEKAKIEINNIKEEFKRTYGVDVLRNLSGKELLFRIAATKDMVQKHNPNNYTNGFIPLFSARDAFWQFGNTCVRYLTNNLINMNYDENNNIVYRKFTTKITEEDAITLATNIRDALVDVVDYLRQNKEKEFYESVKAKFREHKGILMSNSTVYRWAVKYVAFHTDEYVLFAGLNDFVKRVIDYCNLPNQKDIFDNFREVDLFVKNVLELPSTLGYIVITTTLSKNGWWEKDYENTVEDDEVAGIEETVFDDDLIGENRIIYGIPGCGKSYYVKNTLLREFENDNVIRTTFHPEYTNTDFIGQLRPVKDEHGRIDYKVIPGPFTDALFKALDNPDSKVALVIEEINRGNASAIFGDIFQLLDRIDGESEYAVTNKIIEDYFKEKNIIIDKITVPANLYIYATMNTSDQNVFKLDTAFKRRWEFTRLTNGTTNKSDLQKLEFGIPGTCIKDWKTFVDSINAIIVEHSDELNGDRQLGYWFAKNGIDKEGFANKVVEYLYNDVLKYADKSIIFKPNFMSFDDLYNAFIKGDIVFIDGVKLDKALDNQEDTNTNSDIDEQTDNSEA